MPLRRSIILLRQSLSPVSAEVEKLMAGMCYRLCVACRQLQPRSSLFRLLRDRAHNQIALILPGETQNRLFGRSAYLCVAQSCVQQAIKGKKLQKALKTSIPDDIFIELTKPLKG